jgi:SAM-dependent methyltransferase
MITPSPRRLTLRSTGQPTAMSVADFYDRLCPFYHLLYQDWAASMQRQASQLDSVIRELWGDRVKTILDAACGVGTQAIGLAQLGYRVAASDISPVPLERAKREAASRGVAVNFSLADLRALSPGHSSAFDLVIACDNAIPHLLSDDEIRAAFREMRRCTADGGGCLVSVRDYDPSESGTKIVPYGLRIDGGRRFVVFQVWEYQGSFYNLAMYFVEDAGGPECATHVMRSRYYAVPVGRLVELMTEAGFVDVRRIDGRFFQPLIAGFKN